MISSISILSWKLMEGRCQVKDGYVGIDILRGCRCFVELLVSFSGLFGVVLVEVANCIEVSGGWVFRARMWGRLISRPLWKYLIGMLLSRILTSFQFCLLFPFDYSSDKVFH